MRPAQLIPGLALALLSPAALAHDLWLEPSSFTPAVGEKVEVQLKVGDPGGAAENMPRNPVRIERFAALSATAEAPILGFDGATPAGLLRPSAPGVVALVYRTNDARQELPGPKFEAYLAEKGLTEVARLRAARAEAGTPGRELYSRSLKALLTVGSDTRGGDRLLGLDFELVAEANPLSLSAGGELPLRVFLRGQPMPGILVLASPLDGVTERSAAVSDREGRLRLRLGKPGAWVLSAVTMREAPPDSGADWQSIWTSLTFSVPGP